MAHNKTKRLFKGYGTTNMSKTNLEKNRESNLFSSFKRGCCPCFFPFNAQRPSPSFIPKRIAATLASLALLLIQSAALAAYPKLEWTFRIKPDIVPGGVVFLEDAILAAQGERNQLRFVDTETGAPVWSYALDERAELYPLGNGSALAFAGSVVHKLDYREGKRAWSMPACDPRPGAVYITDGSASIACPDGANTLYSLADGKISKTATIPAGAKLITFKSAADFYPSLLGGDSTIVIQGKKASLYTGKIQSVAWSYESADPLAQTAALMDKKLFLLSARGVAAALDPATGKEIYSIDLKKIIDMRFWDELPNRLDNYTASRLFSSGGALYVLPPSGLSKIKILAFPPEITLGGGASAGSGDTTQQWALNKAIQAWDRNDFTAALKGFDEASQIWPGSPEVLMFMGMAYSALREANPGYLDQAILELERASKISPLNPDVSANLLGNYMLKAISLDQRAQRDQVVSIYKKMMAADPLALAPYAGLAEIYISEGGFPAAAEIMRASYNAGFFGPDQINLLAAASYLQDDRPSAFEQTENAAILYPTSRFPYVLKGKLFCKQGLYAKAAAIFSAAPPGSVPAKPEVSNYPKLLMAGSDFFEGNALGLSGNYPRAINKLTAFLSWLPSKTQLADYKTKMAGDTRSAGNSSEISLELDARFKGKSYPELAAESEFRIPAMLTLAHFLHRTGDKSESLKQLAAVEKLIAGEQTDFDTLSYIGYYYALNGKYLDKALAYTRQAKTQSPSDAVYGKNYAVALWKNGKKEEADNEFKAAIALGSPTEFLHLDYGAFLLESNRPAEAAAQFKKELEIAPDMYEAKIALGKIKAPQKSAKKKSAKTQKVKIPAPEQALQDTDKEQPQPKQAPKTTAKPQKPAPAQPKTSKPAPAKPNTKFIIPKTPAPTPPGN